MTIQTTKRCPDCAETVLQDARVCKHCGYRFDGAAAPHAPAAAPVDPAIASLPHPRGPAPLATPATAPPAWAASNDEPPPRAAQNQGKQRLTIRWQNLFSFRIAFACIIVSAIIGGLLSLIWHPLVYLWIPLFAIMWIGSALNPDVAAYCPYCHKRVKIGASTCHHCGKVVAGRASTEQERQL